MKSKSTALILFILLAAVNVLAKEGPKNFEPVALTVIWDASASVSSSWSELSSLSRQAISSLRPGEYLEVISAHASRPRLRVAQFIQSGNAEEANTVSSLLKNITCPLLADANVDEALELAFKRMDRFWSKKPGNKAIVIVLTDGRLRDSEAKKICQIAAELRKRSWQLYLTGTYHTNKKLLVSASQSLFNWSLISEANPVTWLQRTRTILTPDAEKKTPPETSQDRKITGVEEPTVEASEHYVVGSKKEDKVEGSEYEVRTVVDSTISIARPGEKTTTVDTALPKEPPHEPNEAVPEANEAKAAIVNEETLPTAAPEEPTPLEREGLGYWWLLIPVTALLCGLGIYLTKNFRAAQDWSCRMNAHLDKIRAKDRGILIARFNGQMSRLGPFNRFSSAHGGSNSNNTIRLAREAVEGRHFKLYRKANDLMLKNLARTPITANGNELKPHGKCRLVLPATITINDNVKLTLELLRQKVASSEKETQNENQG